LQRLTIHERHFEIEKGFKNIRLPRLTHFSYIDYPRELSDMGIAQFVKTCPYLTYVNFSGCSKLNDHTFKLMLGGLKKLKEIIVLRNNVITNEFLQNLTGTSLSLRRIELGGKPSEFQSKLRLEGGIEHFCDFFKG
jgi:hypothetical protein